MNSLCVGVKKGCINPDTYGEICVGCGCCSTDKSVRYPARLRLYQDLLERHLNFNHWIKGWRRIQKRNNKAGITYCKRRISIYKRLASQVKPLGEMK